MHTIVRQGAPAYDAKYGEDLALINDKPILENYGGRIIMSKKNKKLFKDLKAAMEDAIAHQRGELELETRTFIIPDPPCEYKPQQIKKIREVNHYTQSTFAKILNVSIKTVQSWESGLRVPSHAALRLLEIVDNGIYNQSINNTQWP